MTTTQVRTTPVDATPLARRAGAELRITTSHVLLVVALLIGWMFAYLTFLSGFEESHAQHRLYGQLRSELAEGTAPMTAPIAAGAPVALIDAPDAGLHHVVVVEGTTPRLLQSGPGHVQGSVLPGQVGTSAVLGRSLSFGAPFGQLDELRPGDEITVTTGEGVFAYRVEDLRQKGDPVPAALPADGSRLVLVTATGTSPIAPADTLYVDATLTGKAQPATAVALADPSGVPMARDTSATTLAELVLALQLLVASFVGVAWARARWSAVAAWTVGVPLVLAALWLVSTLATRILPNLA